MSCVIVKIGAAVIKGRRSAVYTMLCDRIIDIAISIGGLNYE